MRHGVRLITLVMVFVMCFLNSTLANSSALASGEEATQAVSTPTKTPPPRLISKDRYHVVYGGPEVVVDKMAWEEEIGQATRVIGSDTPENVRPDATLTLSDVNTRTITPPGGTAGDIDAEFSDVIDYTPVIGGTLSGDSATHWYGGSPYNADLVRLTDTINFKGISVGLEGSGWSIGGDTGNMTAVWEAEVTDEWRIYHEYYDLTFEGMSLRASHRATGQFQFDAHVYTINAYDSGAL